MGAIASILVTFESCGTCGKCGCPMAFESHFLDQRRKDGETFYCPNGHPRGFTESELDKTKKLLETQRQWTLAAQNRADSLEKSLIAQKGITTRIKNRVGNGVCPCCNRSFCNLQKHMTTKHPDYKDEK